MSDATVALPQWLRSVWDAKQQNVFNASVSVGSRLAVTSCAVLCLEMRQRGGRGASSDHHRAAPAHHHATATRRQQPDPALCQHRCHQRASSAAAQCHHQEEGCCVAADVMTGGRGDTTTSRQPPHSAPPGSTQAPPTSSCPADTALPCLPLHQASPPGTPAHHQLLSRDHPKGHRPPPAHHQWAACCREVPAASCTPQQLRQHCHPRQGPGPSSATAPTGCCRLPAHLQQPAHVGVTCGMTLAARHTAGGEGQCRRLPDQPTAASKPSTCP
jgi:hypothetical protein